jgi:hypothetical protein
LLSYSNMKSDGVLRPWRASIVDILNISPFFWATLTMQGTHYTSS